MRFIAARQSVASLVVAILLLWLLERRHLLDTAALLGAAARSPGTLAALAVLLLVPSVAGALRYRAVLQAMARPVPMSPIVTATIVSGALANWLPASVGVMEVMRFSLVARSTRAGPATVSKTDLAVAGLVDRLLGMATVALVGLVAILHLLATTGAARGKGTQAILGLTVLLAAGCALPFVAVRLPQIAPSNRRPWAAVPLGILARVQAALRRVELGSPAFAMAMLASLGISAISILATYLAMQLFAPTTPLLAVAVAFPSLTIASVFPANIAGFGGNQVAAAVVFGALAVDAKAAVMASLVVSMVGLVTSSIAGAICLPRAWQHVTDSGGPIATDDAAAG